MTKPNVTTATVFPNIPSKKPLYPNEHRLACVLYPFRGKDSGQTGQAGHITSESSHGSCKSAMSLGTEKKEDQRVDMCGHHQGYGEMELKLVQRELDKVCLYIAMGRHNDESWA